MKTKNITIKTKGGRRLSWGLLSMLGVLNFATAQSQGYLQGVKYICKGSEPIHGDACFANTPETIQVTLMYGPSAHPLYHIRKFDEPRCGWVAGNVASDDFASYGGMDHLGFEKSFKLYRRKYSSPADLNDQSLLSFENYGSLVVRKVDDASPITGVYKSMNGTFTIDMNCREEVVRSHDEDPHS